MNHAALPQTPDTVPEYRAEVLDFDVDAVIRTVLGDGSSYSLEEDAVSYHFSGHWQNGHFEGVYHPSLRLGIYGTKAGSDGSFDDAAAASTAAALDEKLGCGLVTELRMRTESILPLRVLPCRSSIRTAAF